MIRPQVTRTVGFGLLFCFGLVFSVGSPRPAAGQSFSKGEKTACINGKASGFDCQSADLMSVLTPFELGSTESCAGLAFRDPEVILCEVNDLWGWTDPDTGNEYALVGREDGTAFVDISDPLNPVFLGSLSHNGTGADIWRDIKTYQHYAYIVADRRGGIGIQVFDLLELVSHVGAPKAFAAVFEYPDDRFSVTSAHNIVINEETGFAYVVGAKNGNNERVCGGGLHMVSLANPVVPQFAGCFSAIGTGLAQTGYTHDAQCVVYHGPDQDHLGSEICMSANETHVVIADVTDKGAPFTISSVTYPDSHYIHQGWLTEDHKYYIQNDELDEKNGVVANTRTLIWDVIDLDDPVLIKEYFAPNTSIDHNLYIKGSLVYQSNYVDGLRILDITDIMEPVEVAHFDTHPENLGIFAGSWSNYPFFESGVIAVSSSVDGLFLIELTVQGTVISNEDEVTPTKFVVSDAYPNPFNDRLSITIGIPSTQRIRVAIYDVLGREVRSVYSGLVSGGAEHRLAADIDDLPAGPYYYRVIGEDFTVSKPITKVK
ncbi:MAG: choice-of-anchor B family protein [Bacteroidetes bacterium]|nr:choice-of-anchor B family protein [Bacteroidota bacterium]